MKIVLVIFFLLYAFTGIGQKQLDTTWRIRQNHFRLKLYQDTSSSASENTILTLFRNGKCLISDRIFCSWINLKFADFNKDGVSDLLVFQSSGARANDTYYCYLYRRPTNDFKKVIGFDEWPNLRATEIPGVLVAEALTGTRYYYFLRIKESAELVDLKIVVEDKLLDESGYHKGIEKVKKLKK